MKYFSNEGLISSIIALCYQIFLYVVISILVWQGYHHLLHDVCIQCSVINNFWLLKATSDEYTLHILFSTTISLFRRLYTTYGCHILISMSIYYLRRLHITFDSCILLLALPDCDFVSVRFWVRIWFILGSGTR